MARSTRAKRTSAARRSAGNPAPAAGGETCTLVLQGGGALGAYQAGVYEEMQAHGLAPAWVAGVSIGAINAAIIAGNPPGRRVDRLYEFWNLLTSRYSYFTLPARYGTVARELLNHSRATLVAALGVPGFFEPRLPPAPFQPPGTPGALSYYDTAPLQGTLERLIDFDLINTRNPRHKVRLSVGAVHVTTGNFRYFDSSRPDECGPIGPRHVMASGALPPGFPPIEIDGEFYWDGGLVSNTPLSVILDEHPRPDALVFQVDLWSAGGTPPANVAEVATRQKDIQYSSRTRMITELQRRDQQLRKLLLDLVKLVPGEHHDHPARREAVRLACARRVNVQHLIYRDKPCESHYKDYQFGPATMREHWASGLDDIRKALSDPQRLVKPSADKPFVTWDGDKKVV